jgi:uncharacterized protein YkwD
MSSGSSGSSGDFPGQWPFGGRGQFADGGSGASGLPKDVVPAGEYCAGVADWPESAQVAEQSIASAVSAVRAVGASCSGPDRNVMSRPVGVEPALRCAARLHAKDMFERAFFSHTNPDGEGPAERMTRAGYVFGVSGETIAEGELSEPEAAFDVLAGIFATGGSECETIMNPRFDAVGVGSHEGLWTLDFAGP